VHGKDALKGFEFEQDGVFDDDVGEVALVQAYVLVDDGERNFAFELQVVVLQFPAEAMTLDGLEKAGAEFSVHLNAETDDAVGQSGIWFRRVHSGPGIGRALPCCNG
jgi:hypothetical protein